VVWGLYRALAFARLRNSHPLRGALWAQSAAAVDAWPAVRRPTAHTRCACATSGCRNNTSALDSLRPEGGDVMSNYSVKRIDEMETAFGGGMRLARAALGVTSFGMQVEEFPPNFDQYPEHSHSEDGQEEVYVVLGGSAEIEIEGKRIPLDPETIVRVGPGVSRRIFSGPQGVRILALGGVPGTAYEPPDFSKIEA
jgi:mannose-6-phosphate isomerase-like protein (cupin superfamily)